MMDFLGGLVLIAFIVWQQRYISLQKLEIAKLKTRLEINSILDAFGIPPDLHKFDEDEVTENDKEDSDDKSA